MAKKTLDKLIGQAADSDEEIEKLREMLKEKEQKNRQLHNEIKTRKLMELGQYFSDEIIKFKVYSIRPAEILDSIIKELDAGRDVVIGNRTFRANNGKIEASENTQTSSQESSYGTLRD